MLPEEKFKEIKLIPKERKLLKEDIVLNKDNDNNVGTLTIKNVPKYNKNKYNKKS